LFDSFLKEIAMPHRFKIVPRKKDQFGVQFLYNKEIIVWSENYTTKATANNCIKALKSKGPAAPTVDLTKGETGKGYRFEIDASKDGQTYVRFVASNGETMVRSETYTAKASAKNAIASVKKNGPNAEVVDEA
jgi:uncharacterized protein